eukprot:TRINITY_DN3000_c0_g1_i2.p2 TRINITY_DN3000_c0_g1~~TRINITY_DN3000_c0_g1_i2.p2  ORF type:complete len:61 (-),score=1.13 TRINITY_DN3000_c0_g1_i2:45-227(-)
MARNVGNIEELRHNRATYNLYDQFYQKSSVKNVKLLLCEVSQPLICENSFYLLGSPCTLR